MAQEPEIRVPLLEASMERLRKDVDEMKTASKEAHERHGKKLEEFHDKQTQEFKDLRHEHNAALFKLGEDIKETLKGYTTKAEFLPVRIIAFGLVGAVCLGVLTALMALVIPG